MSKWKRFLAVCCSHGNFVSHDAVDAVLKFKKAWNPHEVIHMGDAMDCTAYRSNARGHKDEFADIEGDWSAAMQLFEQLEITVFMAGNHEARLYKLQGASSSIVAHHAHLACQELEKAVTKTHKAKFYPYDIKKGFHRIGDLYLAHGYKHSQSAVKWHAEYVGGNVAMGHIHTASDQEFEGLGNRRGFSVGMLADDEKLDYAMTWPTRSRWTNAFLWGEYNDKYAIANLCRKHNKAGWRLPIV